MVEAGLQPSGRVIAGGRLLLACLFLLAVWSDQSQPARAPAQTYTLLVIYVGWAATLTSLTWRDWWLDARLAFPAHLIDIAVFMVMLYSTEGYTSPYFTFFVFLLLSAAIRWGWRETAATAGIVIIVYFMAGLVIAPTRTFDTERFIVRTGHLLILSAILIWFGSNQRIAWPLKTSPGPVPGAGSEPLSGALRLGMAGIGARRGKLLWRDAGSDEFSLIAVDDDGISRSLLAANGNMPMLPVALYNVARRRGLTVGANGRWRFGRAGELVPEAVSSAAALTEGLAIPLPSGMGSGIAFLEGVPNLSTDHLNIGSRLGHEMADHLQASAMLAAAEESSIAKARVSVARDLHDSVVQFLAGLGFRLEALTRSPGDGAALKEGLADLKQLVMAEQGQLRAFIGALRTGGSVAVEDLEREAGALCRRLARQWAITCDYAAELDGAPIPVRLQLDVLQLIREGIANSVRHGKARRVSVVLRSDADQLALSIEDDGGGFAQSTSPASLAARVKDAGGEMKVESQKGKTIVMMRLPAVVGL